MNDFFKSLYNSYNYEVISKKLGKSPEFVEKILSTFCIKYEGVTQSQGYTVLQVLELYDHRADMLEPYSVVLGNVPDPVVLRSGSKYKESALLAAGLVLAIANDIYFTNSSIQEIKAKVDELASQGR